MKSSNANTNSDARDNGNSRPFPRVRLWVGKLASAISEAKVADGKGSLGLFRG